MDGVGVSYNSPSKVWTVEEANSHIASLDVDSLRTILSDLAQRTVEAREALQKHAKQQQQGQRQSARPDPPHASHSMSKKRRAENELERSEDVTSTIIVKTDNAITCADPPASKAVNGTPVHTEGDKLVIEGQSGLVTLPAEELNEASGGDSSKTVKTRLDRASKQDGATS